MTSATHRRIGQILGFPECCVEEWVSYRGIGQAIERGSIDRGPRPEDEKRRLRRELVEVVTRKHADSILAGTHLFVSCTDHMSDPSWRPW
jgi:hypothetical protein